MHVHDSFSQDRPVADAGALFDADQDGVEAQRTLENRGHGSQPAQDAARDLCERPRRSVPTDSRCASLSVELDRDPQGFDLESDLARKPIRDHPLRFPGRWMAGEIKGCRLIRIRDGRQAEVLRVEAESDDDPTPLDQRRPGGFGQDVVPVDVDQHARSRREAAGEEADQRAGQGGEREQHPAAEDQVAVAVEQPPRHRGIGEVSVARGIDRTPQSSGGGRKACEGQDMNDADAHPALRDRYS